jgi:hypothetical protein
MLWYGPGHVPAVGEVSTAADMSDVAPTIAELIGYDFEARDGEPMREAVSRSEGGPPRLVVVVVWDGGGQNVLAEYPDAWPVVRSLIPKGAWFERFTLGSSPSVTPAIHTTLGTGAYPRHHGIIDLKFRMGERIVPSFEEGPRYLMVESLADAYDAAMGNQPVIGMVGFRTWHLGMIGHGAAQPGGDQDIAALMEDSLEWNLPGANADFYEFPDYVNDVGGLEEAIDRMDREDGKADGAWLGVSLTDDANVLRDSPAYTDWQALVLEEIIRQEGFGADRVPDLLFTNFKQIDEVGHRWTMNSPQMPSVVRASDRALGRLIEFLDQEVGKGRWVIALTADHGVTPKPSRSGAVPIRNAKVVSDLNETFGEGLVRAIRPSQIWIDRSPLRENGFTVAQVSRFVAEYTRGQNADDPSSVAEAVRDQPVFAAAFPSSSLRQFECLPREA